MFSQSLCHGRPAFAVTITSTIKIIMTDTVYICEKMKNNLFLIVAVIFLGLLFHVVYNDVSNVTFYQ